MPRHVCQCRSPVNALHQTTGEQRARAEAWRSLRRGDGDMIGNKKGPDGTDGGNTGSEQLNSKAPGTGRQQSEPIEKMDISQQAEKATVDSWFDRQLHQLYAEVISEPLPKEFLDLIDQLRDKAPEK